MITSSAPPRFLTEKMPLCSTNEVNASVLVTHGKDLNWRVDR